LATRIASFDKWAIVNTKRLVKPPAYRRTSRSLDARMTSIVGRLRRAGSRFCLSKGLIGPETQKIAWDFIWGHSAAEADTLKHENSPKICGRTMLRRFSFAASSLDCGSFSLQ
jgi:hypothetical protein